MRTAWRAALYVAGIIAILVLLWYEIAETLRLDH
jgi:hypothetical protein